MLSVGRGGEWVDRVRVVWAPFRTGGVKLIGMSFTGSKEPFRRGIGKRVSGRDFPAIHIEREIRFCGGPNED